MLSVWHNPQRSALQGAKAFGFEYLLCLFADLLSQQGVSLAFHFALFVLFNSFAVAALGWQLTVVHLPASLGGATYLPQQIFMQFSFLLFAVLRNTLSSCVCVCAGKPSNRQSITVLLASARQTHSRDHCGMLHACSCAGYQHRKKDFNAFKCLSLGLSVVLCALFSLFNVRPPHPLQFYYPFVF